MFSSLHKKSNKMSNSRGETVFSLNPVSCMTPNSYSEGLLGLPLNYYLSFDLSIAALLLEQLPNRTCVGMPQLTEQ